MGLMSFPPKIPKQRTEVRLDNSSSGYYSWALPFLPAVAVRSNRVPELYQHVVWQHDPTLLCVGAVQAGLTFKIFEWQAVYAARLLAGRATTTLPPVAEMQRWEADRIRARGDGAKFALVFPDFEDYFETLRKLAGEGHGGAAAEQGLCRREADARRAAGDDVYFSGKLVGHDYWEMEPVNVDCRRWGGGGGYEHDKGTEDEHLSALPRKEREMLFFIAIYLL